MPSPTSTYVIEFGKFARIEGGDARGKGGTLVTRKRGDLIELTLEQAAEKHESVRLATSDEIAAGRALKMERNPLPLPQDAKTADEPPAAPQEPAQPEPEPPVEEVAPAPPIAPPAAPPAPVAPPAPAPGNEETPKPREAAGKKKTASKKKTAGKKK